MAEDIHRKGKKEGGKCQKRKTDKGYVEKMGGAGRNSIWVLNDIKRRKDPNMTKKKKTFRAQNVTKKREKG